MKMAEYTLMNKNRPVVSFRYDRDIHAVVKIVDVHDLRYAPVALADSKGIVTRRALNDWWRRRAIPASRHQIQQLLDSLNLNSTLELVEENFGLSLSDRYWINDSKNPLKWEDVNFFDNDFTDDLGMLTLGQESSGNPNLMSPNSTLGGDLNKKWKIVNGKRILVKGGTGSTRQEVLNEVVATALYNRLLSRNDYVPYFLFEEKEILSHGNDGIQARLDVIESRIERNIGSVQRHIEKLAVGQKEPLHVKRDKVLQIPRMNDSVSRTERER